MYMDLLKVQLVANKVGIFFQPSGASIISYEKTNITSVTWGLSLTHFSIHIKHILTCI